MIITIGGLPGSGKTTKAKMLSERLGMHWYSMGDIRGKMAAERGMTIDEFNDLGMTESFTDTEVDDYQRNLGKTEDNFIADGRMSWHFIPHAFKIFLTVDPAEGARRVFEERRHEAGSDEHPYASVEEAQAMLTKRAENDRQRYQKYYNVDYLDPQNYDVVVDSTSLTAEEAYSQILQAIEEKRPGELTKLRQ